MCRAKPKAHIKVRMSPQLNASEELSKVKKLIPIMVKTAPMIEYLSGVLLNTIQYKKGTSITLVAVKKAFLEGVVY